MDMNELLGLTEKHVEPIDPNGIQLHRKAIGPLSLLAADAERAGFSLKVCSGFRSFAKQLRIWNEKATGIRPVLGDDGKPADLTGLNTREILHAILRWSALPGASRHHWGSDFDVFDGAAMTAGYELQLTLHESRTIFAPFHEWLDRHMSAHGFFRPYPKDSGGVGAEPWHLSYAPLSLEYQKNHSEKILRELLERSDIELKNEILDQLPNIYSRFIANVAKPA